MEGGFSDRGMLPLGAALEKSGAAALIARQCDRYSGAVWAAGDPVRDDEHHLYRHQHHPHRGPGGAMVPIALKTSAAWTFPLIP
jgi:hypothetical protein